MTLSLKTIKIVLKAAAALGTRLQQRVGNPLAMNR
jgi:hypothetical protein